MYRQALLRGIIGLSASVGLATPCFAQGISEMGAVYALPKPNPANSGMMGGVGNLYRAGAASPTGGAVTGAGEYPSGAAVDPGAELTSVQIKQLKASAKQAVVLYQKGLQAEKQGNLKAAQTYYYQTLVLRQKLYGKGDSGIYILTSRLGDIGLKQKDWEYADKCFKELMKSQNKAHGPGDYVTVPILLKLSQVEQGRKAIPAQIDYLERALTLQERKVGPNAPECLATRLSLISATMEDGDWRDGDERVKKAIEIENGKGQTKTREYLQLLKDGSKIMTALNKPIDASDYDRKATELEVELPPPKTQATAPAAAKPQSITK
jgi:tetratricopeptide (TPR) repeat protein